MYYSFSRFANKIVNDTFLEIKVRRENFSLKNNDRKHVSLNHQLLPEVNLKLSRELILELRLHIFLSQILLCVFIRIVKMT